QALNWLPEIQNPPSRVPIAPLLSKERGRGEVLIRAGKGAVALEEGAASSAPTAFQNGVLTPVGHTLRGCQAIQPETAICLARWFEIEVCSNAILCPKSF